MKAEDIQRRLDTIKSEGEGMLERSARDTGVIRACLIAVGASLQVASTSWQGYPAVAPAAGDLGLRDEQGQPIRSTRERMTRNELEAYMHAFIRLLHQPPDTSLWDVLVQQYDDRERRDGTRA